MDRRAEIIRLKETGLTYIQIGRIFGISKERARQIIKGNPCIKPRSSQVMLTTSEVASIIGVHTNTVRRWSGRGVLRTYRIGSRGDRRFRREDIESFIEQSLEVIKNEGKGCL